MHYKRRLGKCEKEQMYDSYMKSFIINSCKEFLRNKCKERGNAKEVPLDDYSDELSIPGPDEKELFSLLLSTVNNPVDSFINEIKQSISDDTLYRSLQKLTDIQTKVLCLRYLLNYKFQIIAALCGTSEASAKKINRVAKDKLHRLYNGNFH